MSSDERRRPLFMISVAAGLAEMHPQTLRMYERRGLVRPQRSSKSTRLYSLEDVERLRRIQQLVAEEGLNLAGVERVLNLESRLEEMERRMRQLEQEMESMASRAQEKLEQLQRSYRRELVPVSRQEVTVCVSPSRAKR